MVSIAERSNYLQTLPRVVRRFGHADAEISVIEAIIVEVQFQNHLTCESGVIRIDADIFFCADCGKEIIVISLTASQTRAPSTWRWERVLTIGSGRRGTVQEQWPNDELVEESEDV